MSRRLIPTLLIFATISLSSPGACRAAATATGPNTPEVDATATAGSNASFDGATVGLDEMTVVAAVDQTKQEQEIQEQAEEWGASLEYPPLGYASSSPDDLKTPTAETGADFIPIEDRWRIGFPDWDRYPEAIPGEYPYRIGHWWDPYDQNVLKGDYPIIGQHTFFDLTATSDTFSEFRRLPTPSGVSAADPGSQNFFRGGNQTFVQQFFITSFDLFHGDAGFKPLDWELKFTPVANINYEGAQEQGIVNINPADGTTRLDSHIGIQEAYFEYKLADLSPYYDFVSLRTGIQSFTSDFRGFIFSDEEPGARLFGTYDDNIYQWNVAYFRQLEKDTNSGLNTVFKTRGQSSVLANFTRQDFIFDGYDSQLDFAYNHDTGPHQFDNNGFQVRPALIGTPEIHTVNAYYLGITGDGHIGRINVTDAFYEAWGRDDFNDLAGHPVNINAQMAALELSYDRDWMRYSFSFFYASGDGNTRSHTGSGFDSILDNPDFAASDFGFWQRQAIELAGTAVDLKGPFSLFPDLRSSKDQGQANFVNPGLLFYDAGLTAKITPKLVAEFNVGFSQFDKVGALETALHQKGLGDNLGIDWSLGIRYRPLLIDNIIFQGGIALFTPFSGFTDIYTAQTLYAGFTALTLTY
jgi:hypothetical protein